MSKPPAIREGARILDVRGRPFQAEARPLRMRSLHGGPSGPPYDAAGYESGHMAAWMPYLGSADWDNNLFRDRIVSRVRDLIRNDGWANGAVNRLLDNIIGATFRPISKPDYVALAAYSGNKKFDAVWAREYARAINSLWGNWADDAGKYADAQRALNANQLFRLAFRHKLFDGDAIGQLAWMPERVGVGRARYATCLNLIDPDRLSNPAQTFDMLHIRGGCELDEGGATIAYYIRRAHQGDWFAAADSIIWDRMPRETKWGRPLMVHDFERTRATEHRGVSIFAPILDRFRMLAKYDRVELDAAVINATFAAFTESPMDPQLMQEALGDEVDVSLYQDGREEYHRDRRTLIGDSRMINLYPGERVGMIDAARPTANYGTFQRTFVRHLASNLGMTEQQFSQDWEGVNFSSARAALLEVWKTTLRRRADFGANFGMPVRCAVLEEFFDVDEIPLPSGGYVPDFLECRTAYARCRWSGPGRGYPDPVADREGAVLAMTSGLSTLEQETLEGSGDDWEENLEQIAEEKKRYEELNLEPPAWMNPKEPGQPNRGGSHDPTSPTYRSNPGGSPKK